MSGLSPARRLRTKTSDITDFFRSGGNTSAQLQQGNDASTSTTLDVPMSDGEGNGLKKKITRIPLFGRSRKKSNHSAASSPFASSSVIRDSSDIGEFPSRAPSADRDRRPSEPSVIDVAPPVPSKVPTSSLSSKFAAHFSHSRSSKPSTTAQASSLSTPSLARPSTLSPHSTRSPSLESDSSKASKSRSITPRPAQPKITVSLSPDDLDQFKDLFTRGTTENVQIIESLKTKQRTTASDNTPAASHSAGPRTRPVEASIYRRGHTPASAIAAAVRDRQAATGDRPPSVSSKNSRKNSDSDKSSEKHDGSSTPRPSSARESPRPEREKSLPPSLTRRPSVATGSSQASETTSSVLRSRMKQPSTPARSRPPSMPLPLPPTPTSPPPDVPSSPRLQTAKSVKNESESSLQKPISRPRAHTISSMSDPLITVPSFSRPLTAESPKPKSKSQVDVSATVDVEPLDVGTATAEQLRRALNNRNKHIEELAAYLIKKEQEWSADRKSLEKKITILHRDLMRRDSEITGLKLIINDEDGLHRPKPLPPGILNHSRLSPTTSTIVDSDQEIHGASRRLYYQSDSGAESHPHSGTESIRASGGSGTESLSSSRGRLRRPFGLGDITHGISKTGSVRRSSKLVPDKKGPETPYAKRLSMTSSSSSPSSSTSSLLPPSPSVTMSSLSAIPEGPPSSTLRPLKYDSSEQHEDRRAQRAAHRTSTSSMTSSSTAASSGYSVNIKRSRPPSIAQVLEKSPNMEDVLEKLRPFA